MSYAAFGKLTIVLLVISGATQAAQSAQITEIVTQGASGSGADYPPYVEIYAPGATEAFDLIVVDAGEYTYTRGVQAVVTITPQSDSDTYIIHQDDWPTGPAAAEAPPNLLAEDGSLWLGGKFDIDARTLLVFDHATGITRWTRHSVLRSEPGLLDVVTYTFFGDSAVPLGDEPILPLGGDENALVRLRGAGSYTDTFVSGVAMADELGLRLEDGPRLSPGRINALEAPAQPDQPTAVPEPTALLTLALMGPALLGRRLRSRKE